MQSATDFNTGVVRPVECIKEGWELIKDDYWLFFGVTIIGLLIGGAIPVVIIGPMLCGIYLCFLKKHNGAKVEFADMFKGFDYFVPSLIATLIIVAIFFVAAMILIVIPALLVALSLGVFNSRRGETVAFFFLIVYFILIFIFGLITACVHALIIFTHLLIVDRGLSGWEALKLSAQASWKNLSGVVGFICLQIGLSILGLFALVIGAYLVLPIIYAGTTVMYRKVFPPLAGTPDLSAPPPPANYYDGGFNQ